MAQRFAVGTPVLVPDEDEAYVLREVVSCQGLGSNVRIEVSASGGRGGVHVVPSASVEGVTEADPLALGGAEDMVKFTNLTAASLLHNLRVRYAKDLVYSCAGSILVSVNPFKELGIYGEKEMTRCKAADAKSLQELPPHVFVVAENAFRGMLVDQKMQAILISGESGAGKTEAAKQCVKYIVARSASSESGNSQEGGKAKFIERCILQANPLLEALGNAKTVRNSNSSRFGKWIDIQFDASGMISSSRVTSYLLEKSRVVEHAQGERTYHVLYQLCKGSTEEERKALQLLPPSEFRYIGSSSSMQVVGIEDVAQWRETADAMNDFKMSEQEQSFVRRVLAGLLHLGNLHFEPVQLSSQDDGSCVAAASASALRSVSDLFAVTAQGLEQALTVKSVGKFPVVQVPQPPEKAAAARDALAKAVYGHLFEWIISRINEVMSSSAGSFSGADAKRKIGLLDIFGFEAFKKNSLEQLLINYANEKLQQFFNIYIFRLEEQECRAEGVECPTLEFADNSAVMQLLESKPTGVLSLVNEEVLVPNASEANLLQKMVQAQRSHSSFKQMPRSHGEGFTITHFAGDVSYEIEGFVDKSRDALPGELSVLMATSSMAPLPALFKPGGDAADNSGGARQGGARARSGGGSRRVVALGKQFQDSLDALMRMLDMTAPHFIRCVKPNSALVSDQFDGSFIMRQLEQMGMVHVVRARKQGYAHRYPFDQFITRYGYLSEGLEIDTATCKDFFGTYLGTHSPPDNARTQTVALLASLVSNSQLDRSGWAIGTGKLFLKAAQQQQLEVAREAHLRRVITMQLREAIGARNLDMLEKAVAAAVEVRLQSELVHEAQRLLALLRQQREAEHRLKEAIATRDIGRIEAALAKASQVSLTGDILNEAQRLLSQLRAQQVAAAALTAALQSNKVEELAAALEKAKACGLNTGQVQEAQRRLEGLQQSAQLERGLMEASRGTNLQLLAQLVAQADEIGMSNEASRAAHRQLATLQETAHLNSQLEAAMEARDKVALQQLLQRAASLKSPQADELRHSLDKARALIEELEAEDSVARAREAEAAEQAAAVAQQQAERQAKQQAELRAAQEQQLAALMQPPARQQPAAYAPISTDPMSLAMAQMTFGGSAKQLGAEIFDPAHHTTGGTPCLPLPIRVQRMQAGCVLIKVAQGKYKRHPYTPKDVKLSQDCRHLTWESGKKSVDLPQVLRVSIGLETKTLQKVYQTSPLISEMPSYHWFSLHTSSRSYDFGVKDCGDENEMLVMWVLTLQELIAAMSPTSASLGRHLTALSHAQQQWQRYETLGGKEWPCIQCTFLNAPSSDAQTQCASCGTTRPLVTLCPCMTPMLPMMRALANTLGLQPFEQTQDAHLQWFLLKAIEAQPPPPFKWHMGTRRGSPGDFVLGVYANGSGFTAEHPHFDTLRTQAEQLRHDLNAAGGQLPPLTPLFVAPDELVEPSSHSGSAKGPSGSRQFAGLDLADHEVAEALALEASLSPKTAAMAGAPSSESVSHNAVDEDFDAPSLDAADVFRHCMSGSVQEVRKFLELGGHADTVYKSAYGWDVGPDWLFTKPNDGTSVLNYVATWTDVIGAASAELVRLLLKAGADPRRDDGLEQWFTPIHNAVANGARDVVEVILQAHPEAVQYTTGDGRTPAFMLALCDDAADRMATLNVLIKYRADLRFAEPFEGNTALHALARAGFAEVVARLLEVGAPASSRNEAGRTALQEAQHELRKVELETEGNSSMRRDRLLHTIQVMELDAAAQ